MKTILTIFIFSILVFTSKAQWVELDPGVDVPYFSDVYAITPDIAVVVGANGTILKTTDGGETWVQKLSGTSNGLSKVQFPNPDIGYIIGGGGTLLKTIDGGETWSSIDLEQTPNLLSCVNENLIFISTNQGIIKSENGGQSWTTPLPMSYNGSMQFVNNDTGFIGNDFWSNFENAFAKTTDSGQTWQELDAIAPFYFLNENTGFYYFEGLYKTTDGADQFELISEYSNGIPTLSDIFAINENIVWGIRFAQILDGDTSTRGIIKISSNEPELYTEEVWHDPNPEINMVSIHFADEANGYIVGEKYGNATIWKNGTGINTMSISDNEVNNRIKIYPNPASKEINIEIENSSEKNCAVVITDLAGKQIYFDSFSGNKLKINTSRFPKGTYILSVETKQKKYSQKIIIN